MTCIISKIVPYLPEIERRASFLIRWSGRNLKWIGNENPTVKKVVLAAAACYAFVAGSLVLALTSYKARSQGAFKDLPKHAATNLNNTDAAIAQLMGDRLKYFNCTGTLKVESTALVNERHIVVSDKTSTYLSRLRERILLTFHNEEEPSFDNAFKELFKPEDEGTENLNRLLALYGRVTTKLMMPHKAIIYVGSDLNGMRHA